jgi:hypothetical protein
MELAESQRQRHGSRMVEFVAAAHVRERLARLYAARQQASEQVGGSGATADPAYWESLFEANAAAVLTAIDSVGLPDGLAVRYRCYGQHGRDLLVRPFVARSSTDVSAIRRLIDWHPPPDSMSLEQRHAPTQDVDLLYRHFQISRTADGVFDYWMVMQELWASARWTHSHVLASAEELSQITAAPGWEVLHPVEQYQPAVVCSGDASRLAVLVQCPLQRFEINLQQIDIDAQQALHYADPILVASGPRGWVV